MFTRERIRFPCCLLYNFGCIIGIVQGGLQRCRRCNPPSPPVLLTPAVTKTIIPPNFALGGIFFSRGKLSQTHRGFAINGAKGVNRFAPGFQDVHVPVRRVKAKPLRGACAALTRLPRPPSRHRPFWGPLVRSAGRSRVLVGSPPPPLCLGPLLHPLGPLLHPLEQHRSRFHAHRRGNVGVAGYLR